MHRTLKEETAQPPRAHLREPQKAFDPFRQEYNQERPHAALQGRTPADCYQESPRPYPSRIAPVEYPDDFAVRQVSEGGQIRWNSAYVFVGRALGGEPIGLEPTAEGRWRVWFSFCELGAFDEARLVIRPCTVSVDRKDPKPHAA